MDNSASNKCPWGKAAPTTTTAFSLADVMSEQLASDLQAQDTDPVLLVQKYEEQFEQQQQPETSTSTTAEPSQLDGETENDFMIAQLLQLELNKEHDDQLKRREEIVNRNSRGNYTNDHSSFYLIENLMIVRFLFCFASCNLL